MKKQNIMSVLLSLLITLFFTACGGGGSSTGESTMQTTNTSEFSQSEYKGLQFYYRSIPVSGYKLNQLNDEEFNALDETAKLQVADKLLTTLFYGYPLQKLKDKIASGNFITSIRTGLQEDRTDKEWLENYIIDKDKFYQSSYNEQVAVDILTRFYAMHELDSYYLNNWIAYILTQTIMFSPAYELDSTHTPNIASVYNRLVTMLGIGSGMRFITYAHMTSEDNWRRFRSPEDNGREMMEIFTLDTDDTHVPLAGKALQNWKLDRDSDTLVVSLNQNRQPIKLFGTTIYSGDDFYRELAKSEAFTKGATTRLVDFFFPQTDSAKKVQIINAIVSSHPETWQDILLQIIFSKEYLLNTQRAKSAEELFFSLAKKMDFKHRTYTFHEFKDALENMHQASMKYKLGKLKRVPLDTLSFANYHKYIRERLLLRKSNPEKSEIYDAWDRQGWSESFVSNDNYTLDEEDGIASLKSFIQYLFHATISRNANSEEMNLFVTHMTRDASDTNTTKVLDYTFNLIEKRDDPEEEIQRREIRKRDIATIVLDYISRLTETYTLEKVQ